MKKFLFIFCLFLIFISVSASIGQGDVRVKCNNFTMNVPSSNVRCYQTADNIPLPDEATPDDFANSQTANYTIYFSDFDKYNPEIKPQTTFYLIDDLGRTSFGLLEPALRLSDVVSNLNSDSIDLSTAAGEVPFLPYQINSPVFSVLPQKIDFSSGSGVRTVTCFQDTISASSNASNLYYSYQGLSADGLYYISAVFPLRSSSLNGQQASNVDWSRIDGSDFQPSLNQLDYYIRSIVIE